MGRRRGTGDTIGSANGVVERRGMWDVLGARMFGANAGHTSVRGFAGLGESVVAAIKVFAFLHLSDLGLWRNRMLHVP